MFLKATRAFLFEHGNDMNNPNNIWTSFNTELLGDRVTAFPQAFRGRSRVCGRSFRDGVFALGLRGVSAIPGG